MQRNDTIQRENDVHWTHYHSFTKNCTNIRPVLPQLNNNGQLLFETQREIIKRNERGMNLTIMYIRTNIVICIFESKDPIFCLFFDSIFLFSIRFMKRLICTSKYNSSYDYISVCIHID